MTNTATQPQIDPTAPIGGLNGLANQGTEASISAALSAAPELSLSPGLAVGAATAGTDPAGTAQAVAQTGKVISTQHAAVNAAAPVGGTSALGDVLGWFGHVGSDILKGGEQLLGDAGKVLNYGLSQVQHEYRYLHDVEATHGIEAALTEGIGIALGAGAGAFLGGPQGAILGAEGATALEGAFLYHDSWARSGAPNYVDPHTRQPVSFGRDIASLLGFSPHTQTYSLVSGTLDAGFDIGLDPLAKIGTIRTLGRDGQASGLIKDYLPTIHPVTAEDVTNAYNRVGDVRRAFEQIAGMSSGEIARSYPRLVGSTFGGEDLVRVLGNTETPDQVAKVFEEAVRSHELTTTDVLPTMAFTRLPFNWARQAARNMEPSQNAIFGAVNPGNWAARFERMPMGIYDPKTGNFTDKIDLYTPGSTTAIYRLARFGETDRVAAQIATNWANAAPGAERLRIYRNLILNNIFALAHMAPAEGVTEKEMLSLADGESRSYLKKNLDELTGGSNPDVNGIYGVSTAGRSTPPVIDEETGAAMQGAVTENQTGMVSIPSLRDLRHAAKIISGSKDLFGRADEFAFHYATQGFFKPLVLQSLSYVLHIALAEGIPNALRLGFRNMVKAGIAVNQVKLGEKASEGDLNAIEGMVWRVLGGTRGEVPDNERTAFAARVGEFLDGHYVVPGLRPGEAFSSEVNPTERETQAFREAVGRSPAKEKYSHHFGLFGTGVERQSEYWQAWHREVAQDRASQVAARAYLAAIKAGKDLPNASYDAQRAARQWLDEQPETYLRQYIRHTARTQEGIDNGLSPHEDWAGRIVENMQGATTGANGTVHVPLIDAIANGEPISDTKVFDNIEPVDRPLIVKGRLTIPDGATPAQRLAAIGFRRVLNPMLNFLSREPIYQAEVFKQYKRLEPLIEKGLATDDEIFPLALSRAANIVIENVHNLHDRTQWAQTMRNIAPFWFAQEQAYRRMGRLLAQDPGAFRKYQLMISGVHNVAFNQQDGQGNNYVVFPGTGWLAAGLPDVLNKVGLPVTGSAPLGMGWSLSSTSVIFPLSSGAHPDLGPVAAIPVQAITNFFPELVNHTPLAALAGPVSAAGQTLLGGAAASQPIWDQLIPNTFVQRLVTATLGDGRGMQSTMMQTAQAMMYQQNVAERAWIAGGRKGPEPQIVPGPTATAFQWQNFIDRLQNQTRIAYYARALLGFVTPVSPEVTVDNWGLPAELNADITKTGSLTAGVQEFLAKHPDAQPYTTFQSTSQLGTSLPSSEQAQQWINANIDLIQRFPLAAIFLMPQLTDTKYSSSVYNQQIAQGLRQKFSALANPVGIGGTLDSASYYAQLYINAGNATYYSADYLPAHERAQATLTGAAKTADEQAWQKWLATFKQQNPIWAEWLGSPDRQIRRQNSIAQMREMFAAGVVPAGPQTDLIRGLLKDWDTYSASVAVSRANHYAYGSAKAMRDSWQQYLTQQKAEFPQLASVIDSVFFYATPTVP